MGNPANVEEYVAELDAQRTAMGMSYQDVADACDVSKATVYRALTGKTEPTMSLLQNIASAVQYKEQQESILPDELTQESYIAYLKQLVKQKDEVIELRAKQLHSHYNKLLRQAKRREIVWATLAIVVMATFIILFLYDFSHLDRGWIQAMQNGYKSASHSFMLSLRDWIGGLLWSV